MDLDGRRQCWWLYGWFSGLMAVGSCFGAVAWAAWMQFLVVYFTLERQTSLSPSNASNIVLSQISAQHAQTTQWLSAHDVTYPFEFLCLTIAKLLVLDRMKDFASIGSEARWVNGRRLVLGGVVVGNAVALVARIVAAVLWNKAGDLASASAAAYAANQTASGGDFEVHNLLKAELSTKFDGIAQYCEVIVLFCIITAFIVVGAVCARRVSSAILEMSNELGAASRQLRRQIIGTVAFVFVTFLLRAIYAIFYALVNSLQNIGAPCPNYILCDSACFNVPTHILNWMLYTPEFQMITILLSSPLALLVALWGMTTERTLKLMRSNRFQKEVLPVSTLRETDSFVMRLSVSGERPT